MIKQLFRRRYGISTRKVGVRREWTWHWYLILGLLAVLIWLSIGGWMFDAGRRIAGFDSSVTGQEIAKLKAQVLSLEGRLKVAQELARSGDTKLHVESAAVGGLAAQLKALQKENAVLKEDLAIFEGLVSGSSSAPGGVVRVLRAAFEQIGDGRYRFRLILVHQHAQKTPREFVGSLRFDLKVLKDGVNAMISVPAEGGVPEAAYRLSFKHIQRLDGEISIPSRASLLSGEIAVMHEGRIAHRYPFSM